MASAGRILIMPKGKYDSSASYEMLDLVFHNGVSWLAKKTVIGIEPSVSNEGYWFKLCESTDLTELNNEISRLESEMTILRAGVADMTANGATKADLEGYLKLSGGDLTGQLGFSNGRGVISGNDYGTYLQAKKDGNNYRNIRVDNPIQATNVNEWLKLVDCSGGTTKQYKVFGEHNIELLKTLISASISGVKFGTGSFTGAGQASSKTVSFDFLPKLVVIIGNATNGTEISSCTILLPGANVGMTVNTTGSTTMGGLTLTVSGNNVTMSSTHSTLATNYVCSNASMKYSWLAIG